MHLASLQYRNIFEAQHIDSNYQKQQDHNYSNSISRSACLLTCAVANTRREKQRNQLFYSCFLERNPLRGHELTRGTNNSREDVFKGLVFPADTFQPVSAVE